MRRFGSRALTLLGFASALAFLPGCPNPLNYGTPRTTPKGEISHTVALEGVGVSAKDGATGTTVGGFAPNLPTYEIRIGLADWVDLGVRLANLTTLGVDGKLNFVKTKHVDVAAAPGFQLFYFSADSGGTKSTLVGSYFHVPVLVGFNIAEPFSIVLYPGITYGVASSSADSGSGASAAQGSTGLLLRGGIGFNIRIGKGFAIHPEFAFSRGLEDDQGDVVTLYNFGLGFKFGKLPDHSMADTQPPPPAQ